MTAKTSGRSGRGASGTSTDRLARLLALVPYVVNRDSVMLGASITQPPLSDDWRLTTDD